MAQAETILARGIQRRLAGDSAWRAISGQWRLPAPPRLTRIETQPWLSATFDGWVYEFTLEATLPGVAQAAAGLVCGRLREALQDADLSLPGQVMIEMNAIRTVVEQLPQGDTACRVTFSALTIAD